MRTAELGRVLFAVSFVLLGAFSLFLPGFGQAWPMVPKWMSWHDALATVSSVILLASSIALVMPGTSRPAALALAVLLFIRMLLVEAPHVAMHPLVEVTWEELGQSLIYIAGAWTIFSLLPRESGMGPKSANLRLGQIVFALATLPIGLSHFLYLNLTAPLIPSWLPFHVPLAYFTGAAWIAGGLGILSGVLARLAATLIAIMVSLFTLLVWVPTIIAMPADLGNLSEICVSAAITGAAWAVAGSFRGRFWNAVQNRSGSPAELPGT